MSTITTTAKPAQIWATMAQATPRAFKTLFLESAETLASSYTGVKQLANALERVQSQYGLKPVFKTMLKSCSTAKGVQDVFAIGMEFILKEKASSKKTPEIDLLVKRINALSTDERVQLMALLAVSVTTPEPATI